MSQAGILSTDSSPQVPTQFDTDSGSAIPVGNMLEILGTLTTAGTSPLSTSGAGNTVTITAQISQALAAADSTKVGLCNFDSTEFAVDVDGFVTLVGGGLAIDSISPNSGTDPVVADGAGLVTIVGTGSITTVGGLNTLTTQLTGLTNHSVQVGAGTATLTQLTVGTNGEVLIGSTGGDPVFATLTEGANITITGGAGSVTIAANTGPQVISITALDDTDSPYTVQAADYYMSCDVSSGVLTIDLPDAPSTGRVMIVKDKGGDAASNNITVTTVGGAVTIDGATTFVMNTAYEAANFVFNGTSYEVY